MFTTPRCPAAAEQYAQLAEQAAAMYMASRPLPRRNRPRVSPVPSSMGGVYFFDGTELGERPSRLDRLPAYRSTRGVRKAATRAPRANRRSAPSRAAPATGSAVGAGRTAREERGAGGRFDRQSGSRPFSVETRRGGNKSPDCPASMASRSGGGHRPQESAGCARWNCVAGNAKNRAQGMLMRVSGGLKPSLKLLYAWKRVCSTDTAGSARAAGPNSCTPPKPPSRAPAAAKPPGRLAGDHPQSRQPQDAHRIRVARRTVGDAD